MKLIWQLCDFVSLLLAFVYGFAFALNTLIPLFPSIFSILGDRAHLLLLLGSQAESDTLHSSPTLETHTVREKRH